MKSAKKKTTKARWSRAKKLDQAKAAKLRPSHANETRCEFCGGYFERVKATTSCEHPKRKRWMPEDHEQSSNHMAFARDYDGALKVLPSDEETRIGDFELYAGRGVRAQFEIWRSKIGADMVDLSTKENEWKVREGQLTTCGVDQVIESCRNMGCVVHPEAAAEKRRRDRASAKARGDNPMAKATKKKTTKTREVGLKSGVNVTETWASLLIKNEQLSKQGKRPLDDDGLIAAMQAEFPSKKNATTITRCTMVRGIFNKGTNMFKAAGPAGVAGRPTSRRYDRKGQVVAARCRVDDDGLLIVHEPKSAKKKTAKKKVKKVVKKTKKVVKKKVVRK